MFAILDVCLKVHPSFQSTVNLQVGIQQGRMWLDCIHSTANSGKFSVCSESDSGGGSIKRYLSESKWV